jgi:hypothetical protein
VTRNLSEVEPLSDAQSNILSRTNLDAGTSHDTIDQQCWSADTGTGRDSWEPGLQESHSCVTSAGNQMLAEMLRLLGAPYKHPPWDLCYHRSKPLLLSCCCCPQNVCVVSLHFTTHSQLHMHTKRHSLLLQLHSNGLRTQATATVCQASNLSCSVMLLLVHIPQPAARLDVAKGW